MKAISNMIFGQDTPEAKQEKVTLLESQIKDAEEAVKNADHEVK